MIYSFLDKEVSKKLNVTADVTLEKEDYNQFVFSLDKNKLIYTEVEVEENDYGYGYRTIRSSVIHVRKNDQIFANYMEGHMVIQLLKLGVKVKLLDQKLLDLPKELQTNDQKSEFYYSLISLD